MKHMLITIAAVLTVALLGGAAAGASPNTSQFAGRLRQYLLRNGTSSNWSGYAVETNLQTPQSGVVSNVQGQWVVPAVSCTSLSTYSSVWVGVDGYSDGTVEQTGTEQDCSHGRARYSAWYEMYPHAMYAVNLAVAPGNTVAASVQFSGTNSYALTLTNKSTGKSFTTTQHLNSAGRQSAEWVAEAPSSYFGVLPLSNFGTMSFTSASADLNGHTGSISDSNWKYDDIAMQTGAGVAKATPSVLSSDGSSFSDTWGHN